MEGYSVIEAAVVSRIQEHFSDMVNERRCKSADIDGVYIAMRDEDADYGCVVDYADGRRRAVPPFGSDVWAWEIMGFFLVRYRGDPLEHDRMVRQVIDRLVTLFSTDKRLGGLVPLIQMAQIDKADLANLNEMPLAWIGFSIDVIDK